MPITTKKGDQGKTDLFKGKRVYKDNLRVEIFGNIDELNAYLGFAKACSKTKKNKDIIENIQRDLFILCSEIATKPKYAKELEKRISKRQVKKLENLIRDLEKKVKLKGDFYVCGQNLTSASIDIARVIARRTERRVVSLNRKKALSSKNILIYLNRLSDFLYLLSRFAETNKTLLVPPGCK